MTENLNSSQFPLYHGTTQDIEGNFIRPAVGEHGHGKGSYFGNANQQRGEAAKDYAWAAKHEDDAWAFAGQGSARGSTGRARVYKVKDTLRTGSAGGDASVTHGEVKSPVGFAIKEQHDIAPGRQGTFPEVNWHQFADQRKLSSWEANHPNDEAIKYGHETLHKAGVEDAPGTIEDNYHPGSSERYVQETLRRQHAQREHPNMSDPSTAEWVQHQQTHHNSGAAIGDPKMFDLTRESKKAMKDPHPKSGMLDDSYSLRVRKSNEQATEWESAEDREARFGRRKMGSSAPTRKMA